mmetsp:Transcript_24252/g.84247  ORF Transcript_24252/g.84247 Transcript_24252/m.84247 type:complete len:673 (-) Transcript_24252:305-2323(-)
MADRKESKDGAAEGTEESEKFFHEIGHAADVVAEDDGDAAATGGAGGEVTTPKLKHNDVMELESMCMQCGDNGLTRLLPTTIPFFKNVIIAAFECDHCGNRNSTVQLAEVGEFGTRHTLKASDVSDRNRQVVRSSTSTVSIPELEFEMPPNRDQTSVFTTVEGLLLDVVGDLQENQEYRDEDTREKINAFTAKLTVMAMGAEPFTLVVDDPAGNSFIENPEAPAPDPHLTCVQYHRSPAQNAELGLFAGNAEDDGGFAEVERNIASQRGSIASKAGGGGAGGGEAPAVVHAYRPLSGLGNESGVQAAARFAGKKGSTFAKDEMAEPVGAADEAEGAASGDGAGAGGAAAPHPADKLFFQSSSHSGTAKEVMTLPTDCYNCSKGGEVRTCMTDIPFFKEVLIMSFVCEHCGYRNVEVKGGGKVPARGRVLKLHLEPGENMSVDMGRDLIKSDTAGVEIPEIGLTVTKGSLGGIYTTVEGMITAARDGLIRANPFAFSGDSGDPHRARKMKAFMERIEALLRGEIAFTMIVSDPMANSWIHSPYAPEPDPRLTSVDYDRSESEDRELGLLDMKTEVAADGTYTSSYVSKAGHEEAHTDDEAEIAAADAAAEAEVAAEEAAEKAAADAAADATGSDGGAAPAEAARSFLDSVSLPLVIGGVVVVGAVIAIALARR